MKPFLTVLLSGHLFAPWLLAVWVSVPSTPYDRQMRPTQTFLQAAPPATTELVSPYQLTSFLPPIHRIPERYTPTWPTIEEARAARTADCKSRALLLLDKLRQAGISGAILVIGQRTPPSSSTHAWVEIGSGSQTLILDPTYHVRPLARSQLQGCHYRPLFGFNGPQRLAYFHPGWLTGLP